MTESYPHWFDLTERQIAGLRMVLENLDKRASRVTFQSDGKALLVTSPDTHQQWRIGPRWRPAR